jgi:hypothetical protein
MMQLFHYISSYKQTQWTNFIASGVDLPFLKLKKFIQINFRQIIISLFDIYITSTDACHKNNYYNNLTYLIDKQKPKRRNR